MLPDSQQYGKPLLYSCNHVGNWLWMSIEFVAVESSSDIHFGPHIPLATMSDELQMQITYVKIGLFAMSLISQLVMYVGIFTEKLEMPRNYDEDLVSTNELLLLCGYPANQTIRDEENEEYMAAKGISTAFVEYTYILFWIMKDLFWSCGTGDVDTSNEELAVFMEILALMCGIFALCSYFVTAYIYRRSWTCLFDALTTLCWIAANFTWMCGEFFLRYDNLQLDDLNEGNDRNTRIVATTFFATGMVLQLVVIVYLSRTYYEPCAPRRRRKKNFYPRIEMRGMVSNGVRAVSVVPRTMNSIRYRGMSSSDADDVILF